MHFGGQEIWIVLGIIVLLFGAKKLPELGKSLGAGIKEFKKSSKGILGDEEEKTPEQLDEKASEESSEDTTT